MRMHRLQILPTVVGLLALGCVVSLNAQDPIPTRIQAAKNPFTGDSKAVTQGAVLFRQECVFCHGVSARGGVRGPDLTTGTWTHGGSDTDLATTISVGVPGTAMPPNRLTEEEIWQIITYLRTLEQPAAPPTGNATHGETLFFGATRCSSCHIVKGRGGRLGPELTTVGSSRSRAYIIESIREPGKSLTENRALGGDGSLKYDTVTLVTADGTTVVGVAMNEDTFTVQVMDMNERVHSLDKKSLKSFKHENRSLMPAYDSNRLNNSDLDDLVAYLQTLRAGSAAKKGGSHEDR
jgi:cytochrome c oxidase cbb3-type subunit 3